MNKRTISVEIFRDYETPDVSIDAAIAGLEEMQRIVKPLEIVARDALMRISEPGVDAIYTGQVPPLDIRTDFGMIVTNRPIVVAAEFQHQLIEGNITIGNTWFGGSSKSFSVIDTGRADIPKNTVKHEAGHLFRIPNSNHYDGNCHCTHWDCVMHPVLKIERDNFCKDCKKQLVKSAANLIECEK